MSPALPLPALPRWQPLRLGLVDLFYYDSEEFWFRDGHLLLRGNNGTGKSKVLSLTLPFLFDAYLSSSRIEPDRDAAKRMSWNLLLGKYDRRIGYAWIELGRIGDDGQPQFLSLGSGLSAAAARSDVDSWFFVLEERRIGRDIWLTSPQRVVLTKERLKDALQGCGDVYETAATYRRVVDERLFHLGTARYSALMDTLIQLRQPQLSKKPDESSLSDALTEALPPLPTELLNDVADALSQLEEDHRQLQEHEALLRGVEQFNARYRLYAGTQSRRQARTLRAAQTGFDSASRELNEARVALTAAQTAENTCISVRDAADQSWRRYRAQLEELQSDPAMQDANRLEHAARDAEQRAHDASEAQKALSRCEQQLTQEAQRTQLRDDQFRRADDALAESRRTGGRIAMELGVAESCADNPLFASTSAQLIALTAVEFAAAGKALRQMTDRRREQIALLIGRVNAVVTAEERHHTQQQLFDERREETAASAERRTEADTEVEKQGQLLLQAWENHFDGLHQLRIDDIQSTLERLADWVNRLDGDNPARAALHSAQMVASQQHAERRADLNRGLKTIRDEQQDLDSERARLLSGEDSMPQPPLYRAEQTRVGRPGAPLWQLVDFQETLSAAERAGIEAGLEASGLLDAWVSPDGHIQITTTADEAQQPLHDTQWLARTPVSHSLSDWLKVSTETAAAVSHDIVSKLLTSVACSDVGNEDAEVWISPRGHFRLGTLAGAWSKPAAAFIGFAARKAARERRLNEIAARLAQIADEENALLRQIEQLAADSMRATAEWQQAPTDDHLRAAHANAAASAREFQAAMQRLAIAEAALDAASQQMQAARQALTADAADLRLPETIEQLTRFAGVLSELVHVSNELVSAGRELRYIGPELQQQQTRETEARVAVEGHKEALANRRNLATAAQARYDVLRSSVGAKVDELQLRLKRTRTAVDEGETALEKANESLRLAGEHRATVVQQEQSRDLRLQERAAFRQNTISHFQQFAVTGLLSVAAPQLDVPDLHIPWTIEPALTLARRAEQALTHVKDDEDAWQRVQNQISQDSTDLHRTLTALGHQSQTETSDFGLIVRIVYQNAPERPDRLATRLEGEIAARRELLTAREREVLENHLQAEIAAAVQRLMQDADRQVESINKELYKRPTSTGVRFRLQWQPLAEGSEGAPVGLEAARKRLLNTSADLWSPEDRRVVGAMLQQRISAERARADEAGGGSVLDQLANALDYRRWHRFIVQRWQDGQWRKLSGPASSGERALGLTVPLFAAVASFYTQSGFAHSPRLVLLDEAFAGIDDDARAHCMGLIREFDLDFVITSEREWGCYAELPGVSICQLQRRADIDAVHVSRWTWDGRAKRREDDPDRRFPAA